MGETATSGALVYYVICIEPGEELQTTVHIFSTPEKAQLFCDRDPRPHVVTDYVIDCPERMEQPIG